MTLFLLPIDLLHAVCSFLSGFDVFYLSHTNSWALRSLSDNKFWYQRVVHRSRTLEVPLPDRIWKQQYMQARSLQFIDHTSLSRQSGPGNARRGFAMLVRPDLPAFYLDRQFRIRSEMISDNFSFDAWFCLFPSTSSHPAGGVIYGLQTRCASKPMSRGTSEQFVLVDTQRDLVCSVLNEKQPVARNLDFSCWYHVALTYDLELQRQDVYVDGKKVWCAFGALNDKLQQCHHEQIGTGHIASMTATGVGYIPTVPSPGAEWYSFNGLIDEFRVWKSVLSSEAIDELARGGQPGKCSILATVKPSHGGRHPWINTKCARCTRPVEGKNVDIHQQRCLRVISRR